MPIPAGTPRCHTPQLEIAFEPEPPAAGNLEDTFEVRNKSATACWVYGFVGFQTLDNQGRPLPQTIGWSTNSFFGRSDPPSRILLAPGTGHLNTGQGTGHAFFNVTTNDVLCDANQVQVATLEIWPPDEFEPLRISAQTAGGLRFTFCGGFGLNPLQIQPEPSLG